MIKPLLYLFFCLVSLNSFAMIESNERKIKIPLDVQQLNYSADGDVGDGYMEYPKELGYRGVFFAISSSDNVGPGVGINPQDIIEIDGFKGIKITEGVIFGITNSQINVTASVNGVTNSSGFWDEFGNFSSSESPCINQYWCSSLLGVVNPMVYVSPDDVTSGSIQPYIYIGANAQLGSYPIPSLYISRTFGLSPKLIYSGDILNITLPPLNCSISTLPQIDFGIVNLDDVVADTLLASSNQGLTISCAGTTGQTASATLTSQGTYMPSNDRLLSMTNESNGQSVAYVRGRIGEGAGSCSSTSMELGFNSLVPITLSDFTVGVNNVPLTWSLCSTASKIYGKVSGKATIDITWD